jgi:hypothetical protein
MKGLARRPRPCPQRRPPLVAVRPLVDRRRRRPGGAGRGPRFRHAARRPEPAGPLAARTRHSRAGHQKCLGRRLARPRPRACRRRTGPERRRGAARDRPGSRGPMRPVRRARRARAGGRPVRRRRGDVQQPRRPQVRVRPDPRRPRVHHRRRPLPRAAARRTVRPPGAPGGPGAAPDAHPPRRSARRHPHDRWHRRGQHRQHLTSPSSPTGSSGPGLGGGHRRPRAAGRPAHGRSGHPLTAQLMPRTAQQRAAARARQPAACSRASTRLAAANARGCPDDMRLVFTPHGWEAPHLSRSCLG